MTEFVLPLQVSIRTGVIMPSGADPYEDTVWCVGSYEDQGRAFRVRYIHKIAELFEALGLDVGALYDRYDLPRPERWRKEDA